MTFASLLLLPWLGIAPVPVPKLGSAADLAGKAKTLQRQDNGARLSVTAEFSKGRKGQFVELKWSITYCGPRPPLTILKPTITRPTSGQTELVVYCDSTRGYGLRFSFLSPSHNGYWIPGSSDFVTADGGHPVTGILNVPVLELVKSADKKGKT